MLKKEIKDALKCFVESLVALVIIPLMYIADKLVTKNGFNFASYRDPGFIFTLVIYAIYAGGTVFHSERKDRAFEYLFSLPMTRRNIILLKILPRLGLLMFLGGATGIVVGRSFLSETGITVLVLFFSSLFLSIGVLSVFINLFGVMLMYLIFSQEGHVFGYLLLKFGVNFASFLGSVAAQFVSAAVLLVPFGIAFWLTFKKMDARPLKLQMRTYYSIILPTIFVLTLLIVFFFRKSMTGFQG